jgi:hypothetical protein
MNASRLEHIFILNSKLQTRIGNVSIQSLFIFEFCLSGMHKTTATSMNLSSSFVPQLGYLFFSCLKPRSNTHRSRLGAAV